MVVSGSKGLGLRVVLYFLEGHEKDLSLIHPCGDSQTFKRHDES